MNDYIPWLLETRRKSLESELLELRKRIAAIENELKTIATVADRQANPPQEPPKETPMESK